MNKSYFIIKPSKNLKTLKKNLQRKNQILLLPMDTHTQTVLTNPLQSKKKELNFGWITTITIGISNFDPGCKTMLFNTNLSPHPHPFLKIFASPAKKLVLWLQSLLRFISTRFLSILDELHLSNNRELSV